MIANLYKTVVNSIQSNKIIQSSEEGIHFHKLMPTTRKRNNKTQEQRKTPHKHRKEMFFTQLLYFETP